MIVHKSDISVGEGGVGKEKKVFVIGELEKNSEKTTYRDGMDTMSMVVSIVGRMYPGVADPFRS